MARHVIIAVDDDWWVWH